MTNTRDERKAGYPFDLPCKYDRDSQMIFDAKDRLMLDVIQDNFAVGL